MLSELTFSVNHIHVIFVKSITLLFIYTFNSMGLMRYTWIYVKRDWCGGSLIKIFLPGLKMPCYQPLKQVGSTVCISEYIQPPFLFSATININVQSCTMRLHLRMALARPACDSFVIQMIVWNRSVQVLLCQGLMSVLPIIPPTVFL